jgi:hypothetical protein
VLIASSPQYSDDVKTFHYHTAASRVTSTKASVDGQSQKLPKSSTNYRSIASSLNRPYLNTYSTTDRTFSTSTAPSSLEYSLEPQIVSINMATAAYSLRQSHDRQGIGSWTVDASKDPALPMQIAPQQSSLPCPHHGPVLQMTWSAIHPREGFLPLERFNAEGPEEQNSVFLRPDTGDLSTARDCLCYQLLGGMLLTTVEEDN